MSTNEDMVHSALGAVEMQTEVLRALYALAKGLQLRAEESPKDPPEIPPAVFGALVELHKLMSTTIAQARGTSDALISIAQARGRAAVGQLVVAAVEAETNIDARCPCPKCDVRRAGASPAAKASAAPEVAAT
jgi:hypothetical protein